MPLFEQLIAGLDPDRRHVILDLGAARAGTIDLFSALRCRLDILDLNAALPELFKFADPDDRQRLLVGLMPRYEPEPANLVLTWNLLNYLTADDIRSLAELLTPSLAPDVRVHALIEYSSPLMPVTPGHWIPDSHARLHADQVDLEQVDSPRYSMRALERLMPQLEAERSVLLGNGLQEHLFRLRT